MPTMPGTDASATRVVARRVAGAVEEPQAQPRLDGVGEPEAEHLGEEGLGRRRGRGR